MFFLSINVNVSDVKWKGRVLIHCWLCPTRGKSEISKPEEFSQDNPKTDGFRKFLKDFSLYQIVIFKTSVKPWRAYLLSLMVTE